MAKQSPEEKAQADANKQYSLTFTKQELVVMFNAMISREYPVGDAVLLVNPLRKIEAIIAVDTNIPQERQPRPDNGVVLE